MKKLSVCFLILSILVTENLGLAEDFHLRVYLPNIIKGAEVKYDLPKGLLKALIEVESNNNFNAQNLDDGNKSAKLKKLRIKSHGLVQMQLGTARMIQQEKAKILGRIIDKKDLITVKKLMDPEINVEYGAMYLGWLLNTHDNDVSWALTCYNVGPYSNMCKNKIYYGRYVGKVLNKLVK